MLEKEPKKILLVRNDRFGEFLLNIPVMRALKETFPTASLSLLVDPLVEPLAACIEYVDEVMTWENKKHSLGECLKFAKQLKSEGFDLCVISNPTKEAHLLSFLAGIPCSIGYSRKWGFLLTRTIEDSKDLGIKHEVESNLYLASLAGASTRNETLSLAKLAPATNQDFNAAIAVHPYTSDTVKEWPLEQFYRLIASLAREPGAKILVVGKEDAQSASKEHFDNLGDNVINLINKTTLVELAQIFKQCRVLVSCDSGPMHLAACVGTPVVALFRNDLPGKTARRWGPWGEGHIVIEADRLYDISVEKVLEAVRRQSDKEKKV